MQSAPDSTHEPIGAIACVHDDAPSKKPEVPQLFFLRALQWCRPACPGHTLATWGWSGVSQPSVFLQRDRRATVRSSPGIRTRRCESQHYAAVHAKSSKARARAVERSPERPPHARAPAPGAPVQQTTGTVPSVLAPTVKDVREAYPHILGTIGHRLPATRQQAGRLPHLNIRRRSLAKMVAAPLDAARAAALANASSLALRDPPSVSWSS